jgi:hypothetical protein
MCFVHEGRKLSATAGRAAKCRARDPKIKKGGVLADAALFCRRMRDISPTLANVMKVSLPQADGKPLF